MCQCVCVCVGGGGGGGAASTSARNFSNSLKFCRVKQTIIM